MKGSKPRWMGSSMLKLEQLRVPLIQGGMGIGVSLGNLAGHVMLEGGLGVISAAQPGYREVDFYQNTIEANLRALEKEVDKARQISQGKGLLGVNVMVAAEGYDRYVKAISLMDIDVIISGAGLPLELPSLVGDSKVALAPIVSSAKAAFLLCKRWLSRSQRLPDLLIIEGPLAGGHLGFSWSDLIDEKTQDLTSILHEVRVVLKDQNWDFPVFVAGGIYTSEDIHYFLNRGAQGVQMATRFIATHECDADIQFKQAFIKAKFEDIRFVISPSGYPGRAINNPLVDALMRDETVKVKRCVKCLKPCNPATTPYCITEALIEAVKGNVHEGLIFTGTKGYRIDKIVSVKELIEELFSSEVYP